MISKRSNTASAKGRDALCVPVQKVKDMEEVSDNGRLAEANGLSPFGSSPAVSPVPASIPSATARLVAALKPWEDDWRDMGMPDCIADETLMLDADGVGGEIITVGHWRELMAALDALRSPCSVENGGFLGPVLASRVAQAIEARRAETQGGSVADESAVAKPCAQGDRA